MRYLSLSLLLLASGCVHPYPAAPGRRVVTTEIQPFQRSLYKHRSSIIDSAESSASDPNQINIATLQRSIGRLVSSIDSLVIKMHKASFAADVPQRRRQEIILQLSEYREQLALFHEELPGVLNHRPQSGARETIFQYVSATLKVLDNVIGYLQGTFSAMNAT